MRADTVEGTEPRLLRLAVDTDWVFTHSVKDLGADGICEVVEMWEEEARGERDMRAVVFLFLLSSFCKLVAVDVDVWKIIII